MKKLIFLFLFISNLAFSQRITWQRDLDFTQRAPRVSGWDFLNDLLVHDTLSAFAFIETDRYNPNAVGYYPTILKINPMNGAILDTIVLRDDTTSFMRCAIDRVRQNIWLTYVLAGDEAAVVYRKINFQGFTLNRRSFSDLTTDSIGGDYIIPAPDGGFYSIGAIGRRIGSVRPIVWQVSRWDSVINRKWVREYPFEYTRGVPTRAEFLPNGNLFVSGYNGGNIQGIEVDTGNGRMLDRKILFSHPRGFEWTNLEVQRTPFGYAVSALEATNATDTSFFYANINHNGRMIRGGFSGNNRTMVYPMSDSTCWSLFYQSGGIPTFTFQKFDSNGVVLHSILLSSVYERYLKSAGYFTNGSAIFGGGGDDFQRGEYLYFCKIDSIGTPYNPIYPPVGPVLTSSQKQNQEPNLQVYPNPFTNTLRLSHKGTAQLLDVHGRIILAQPVEAGEELKVSNLPKGMYLLRLQSVGGKLYVRKVVRE
jgi:hypothetical protein